MTLQQSDTPDRVQEMTSVQPSVSRRKVLAPASIARRGYYLELLTIAWALLEAIVALVAADRSGSLSFAGFGFDSLIEVVSGAALTVEDGGCRTRWTLIGVIGQSTSAFASSVPAC